jgi:4-hydroxy-3-polyprenylbenzoate decarboxylase
MSYKSTQQVIADLEKQGQLVRIKQPIDPYLEAAAIHLEVFKNNGPAILFENIKGTKFPAVSNLFGTLERSKYLLRHSWNEFSQLVQLKDNPAIGFKHPLQTLKTIYKASKALPLKTKQHPVLWQECKISDLPQIQCWPNDGGAFITLPIVYSEDVENPGVMHGNLGMYRVQLSGNDYVPDKEVGLHYQIHRGIGVHQTKANKLGKPLKVSIFIGGSPANIFSAVMPLPEGMSELTFAGFLNNRRFRYGYKNGYFIPSEADFVILGEIYPDETKLEGPFGDHLGYYSLAHPFPVMRVHKVYHRKNAVWSFTVVGRPPQEDSQFGKLIHLLTKDILLKEIPGLKAVNAVDAAGVHPLLLALGSERYTPYLEKQQPQELLTIANHILGTGQMSLAKYLFIAEYAEKVNINDERAFFTYFLERFNPQRDVHFQTNTTIDTLDYSGTGLNQGSKVVLAAVDKKINNLSSKTISLSKPIKVVSPGILAVEMPAFTNYQQAKEEITQLSAEIEGKTSGFPLIIICDDAQFLADDFNNFLWVTFTRSNPATDIYGVNEKIQFKHWSCDALIIDARKKPHHAPELKMPDEVMEKVYRLGEKGKPLHGII